MKFHFRYFVDRDGQFVGQCIEIFSCPASGLSLEQLKRSATISLRRFLIVPPGNCIYTAPPRGANLAAAYERLGISVPPTFTVPVPPGAALALSLRRTRSSHVLYQRDVAKQLGLRSHSAYQRLEDPLRSNPTLRMLARLHRVFPELDVANLFEADP